MIPFNKPVLSGKEIEYILEAVESGQLAGDGKFTEACQSYINQLTGCNKSLLTHSCTAALEMTALIAEIGPGDEIIMPSYTFVSTANAFCFLRGATPVFVDIREDTLNMDEKLVEQAINDKTKAVVAVHYAGVGCEPVFLKDLCNKYDILFVEDAAQGIGATFDDQPLGSFGDLSAISFHETKNVISGEGGCLLINNQEFETRAEIIREKGTDRKSFQRGEIAKYTWREIGSSYLPGELIAAFLLAQLECSEKIKSSKIKIWDNYFNELQKLEELGILKRPTVPESCSHNGHLFYVILENSTVREKLINNLIENEIHSVFHYIPLHSSPAGKKYTKTSGDLKITEAMSSKVLRLPSWVGLDQTRKIVDCIHNFFR